MWLLMVSELSEQIVHSNYVMSSYSLTAPRHVPQDPILARRALLLSFLACTCSRSEELGWRCALGFRV